MEQQALLNTQEAALLLNITPRTLVVWRHEQRSPIPFVRVGRNIRYHVDDIASFIERQTEVQTPDAWVEAV